MDLSSARNVVHFSRDTLLNAVLVLFIIWGLVTKFFISIALPLDSDTVGMGLMSMEIGKHHNYLLSGYHLLTTDSLVFTELVPFQLIPQILTNYNPVALKIMVFLIFCLTVLTLAYLVWLVSGNLLSVLLFSALAAGIPPEGYVWLANPTSHNATILFGAVILVILFSLHRSMERLKETREKNRKKTMHETHTLPGPYILALVTLVFLSVLSDTIILVWVLVPYCIAYLLFFRKENRGMDSVVIYIAITSVIAYLLKTFFIADWINTKMTVNSIPVIISTSIPLFFKALFLFLNRGISALMEGAVSIGPAEVFSGILFAGVIFCCIRSAWSGRHDILPQKRLFYTVLLISVLLITVSVLVSEYFCDIAGARYLTFTALALIMLVAVSCPVTEKTCLFFVLSLLIVSSIVGTLYINTLDPLPNEREYSLITYLKDRNLTFGQGTYWNSNVITYLSGEDVTIRSTFYRPNGLDPELLNSCNRWYAGRLDRFFLIYDETRPTDEAQKNFPLLVQKSGNKSDILQYRDYKIYPIINS